MVRNLRAESDRMHALACICRTALCVDLFAKESVRRGQKPLSGTDITSLFEDVRIKDDLNSVISKSLFREELVASLVESCFQLSLPLPEQKNSGMEGRVIGALAYGTGYGALNWTESALEVVEVCRPCVLWDCDGRTYAIDCYLKLLVRLCHIYDTRGGVKRVKDGASQEQILYETRLRNLQLQLIKDLREFFETSAAQDRKLEGLVHKAIQELWRPEPSELRLLLTKGVDSNMKMLGWLFASKEKDKKGNADDYEDSQVMRQRRVLKPELGEPLILSEVSRNVDLGDETTTMMCKFVVRASDASITKEIGSDLQGWLDDITDGGVEYMPEEEVKIAAKERLRISMEKIALFKAAKPPPQRPKAEEKKEEEDKDEEDKNKENVDEYGNPKEPSTLSTLTAEEVEHRALQSAVLQEWHMLCKEKAVKVQ
ncbi:hypothetical protein BHM03_00029856 [Ensete ventricosum]|nr:hypothetical protein BHM03_00029856 [Ensete ventricosum]